MAGNSVKRSHTVIDPMFFIPEGVDELQYSDDEVYLQEADEETDIATLDDPSVDYSDRPDTPDIIGIISQEIRTSPSGHQVVDVTLEVEDIPGYSRYELRIVKL